MSPDRERLALDMRVLARHLFERALADASIDRAFQRHVDCERGVLRVFEDLFYLGSYRRIIVVSIGKAAHTMVNSLEMQAGSRFEGIVAGSVFMTAADVAMWLAIMTVLGKDASTVTTELKTTFLSSARHEDVTCTAEILKLGKSLIYGVAECTNGTGRLLTHHTITYIRK